MFMIYTPILYIITYLVLGSKEQFLHNQFAPMAAVFLYGVIQALFVSILGQTPGKRAYEIKIVDESKNENISFFRALIRFFLFLVSVALVFGIVYYFLRKDSRAFHDIFVGSKVIDAPSRY